MRIVCQCPVLVHWQQGVSHTYARVTYNDDGPMRCKIFLDDLECLLILLPY